MKNDFSILKLTNKKIIFRYMNSAEVSFFDEQGITYIKIIGKGAFGTIFLVRSKKFNVLYALKKIPEKVFHESEVECIKTLDEGKFVNLYKCFHFQEFVYLLLEYCPNDMMKIIETYNNISDHDTLRYISEMVGSIKACHDKNIAHCDIKPSNFMFDIYGRLKLGDFGLSNFYISNRLCNELKGTNFFMAPEILLGQPYIPQAADIWALGVTLYFLATKNYPFFAWNQVHLIDAITAGKYDELAIQNLLLRQLISKCLVVDPSKRATINDIIDSEYMQQSYLKMPNKQKLTSGMPKTQILIPNPITSMRRSMFSLGTQIFNRNLRPSRNKILKNSRSSEVVIN